MSVERERVGHRDEDSVNGRNTGRSEGIASERECKSEVKQKQ